VKRLVLLALAGIALLLVGALASIFLLGEGHSPFSPAPETPQAAATGSGDLSARPLPALPPAPAPGETPVAPAIEYGPAPAKPPPGSWEAVTPVARPGALGRLGGAITQGLAEVRPAVEECFSAASQARHSGQKVTEVKDEQVAEDNGTATLMLQIEAREGVLRIVDAPVEMRGTASDGLIACVQQALRGQEIPAAAARPGTRYRIPYPITP
jgi:hypothetical protein